METPKITNAQQIKDIIAPISPDLFQLEAYGMHHRYGDNKGPKDNGKSCFLGHIHRHFVPDDPKATGDGDGYGARQLTKSFLEKIHGLYRKDGASVNNKPNINGYTEPIIKDRIMHMLDDMIKAGY